MCIVIAVSQSDCKPWLLLLCLCVYFNVSSLCRVTLMRCGACLFIPVRISSCLSVMTRRCICGTRSLAVLSGQSSCRSVCFLTVSPSNNCKINCKMFARWLRPFRTLYLCICLLICPVLLVASRINCCMSLDLILTNMSVLHIVGPKCMLAALHAVPWWVTVSMPTVKTVKLCDPCLSTLRLCIV